MKLKYVLLVLMIPFALIQAQENLKISAEIRPRLEIDNRDFNNETESKNFTALRSRIGLAFKPSVDLSLFFQVQDSRDFGNETSVTSDMKNLDLHQAYFKLNNIFNLPIDIKAGRMALNYGSGRIIGFGNWGNVGKAFDGAVVTLKTGKAKFDFLAIKEKENYNFGDTADVDLLAVFSELDFIMGQKIEPYIFWQKQIPSAMLSRFTAGIFIKGNINGFIHEVDIAYQFGEITDQLITPAIPVMGATQNISAYIASVSVGYKFDKPIKPYFGIGVDILSGDKNLTDNEYKVFVSPYGSKHKFYGTMDYFKNNPLTTSGLGLFIIRANAAFTPLPGLNVKFDIHLINSKEDYLLADGSMGNKFGTEGDLSLRYKYNKNVTFSGGVSIFMPGEIFKETKGRDNSIWSYLMTVVNL